MPTAEMADALPYFVPSEDAIRPGAWTTEIRGSTTGLPEWLPYWDMSQVLHAGRELEIDVDRVYRETRLPRACRLGLSVAFISDLEDNACDVTLDGSGGTAHPRLEVEIPGQLLGGTLVLSTSLVLQDAATEVEGPVASRRGSILWSDLKKVRLYGDASQFPVSEVDFAECGLDPAAPWYLEIDGDLELPAMGAIQLLLNSRFPLVCSAARDVGGDRPELAVIRSQLFADIGRTLTEFALARDEPEHDWPEDSLGIVLRSLLRSRFREPTKDLQNLRDQDPAAWAARVAASFGLLREPLR
jgi:hypothetical protein